MAVKLLGEGKIDFNKKKKPNKSSVDGYRINNYQKGKGVIRLKKYYYPKVNEKFRIEINGKGKFDRAFFCVSSGNSIDPYPGKFTINGEEKNGDLRISVQKLTKKPLMKKSEYIWLCVAIIIMEILIYAGVFYKSKRKIKK